jgi:mannose-6-phosphate isomerase-like protein (cupin superfamily)
MSRPLALRSADRILIGAGLLRLGGRIPARWRRSSCRDGALRHFDLKQLESVKGAGMSDFTIVNFKEIEDSAADREGMEARFARKHLDSEHLGVTFMRYDANVRSPKAHSHREQEEAYVVVSGSGRIRLDDAVHELRQWDVVRVSPTTVRAFEAGDEGLELIAVGSDRPEGGDGVFAETAWV